ncbi:MAG TPA: hypothetical protein PKD18_22110, partial [Saprospiraceae bacterium]|nr:hypothetical protein [Saprospiraceae bacterium]
SKRPVNGVIKKDYDLWYTEKTKEDWGNPVHLGKDINSEMDEFYPSVASNGNLYFTASYNESATKEDIFMAQLENGNYLKPVPLDTAVNTSQYEFNAFIAPDESYILFTAYGRKGDKGRGDIYLSLKRNGKWQPAKQVESINSDKLDYCPTVSLNGKVLNFTSERSEFKSEYSNQKVTYQDFTKIQRSPQNGNDDIYWVNFEPIINIYK